MASFSACKPLCRAYSDNNPSTTTFKTNYYAIGKMVKVTATPQFKEGNLYGDNAIAENKKVLSYYDISLETTDFPTSAGEDILGLTKTTSGSGTSAVNTYKVKTDTESNYCIFGYIYGKVVNSVNKYVVEIFKRVKFDLPTEEYSTSGENIEFHTKALTAKAYADSSNEFQTTVEYDTLAAAITALETTIGGTLVTSSTSDPEVIDTDGDDNNGDT